MKKVYFSILVFLFLIIPINIFASEEGITSFYIDATVMDSGDLRIKELIILNGEFNGFERVINYKNNRLSKFDGTISSFKGSDIYNSNDIELINIKDIPVSSSSSFESIYNEGTIFNKVYSANKGDYGKYIINPQSNYGYTYTIYNPSKGKEKGFYIEYTVKNLGVVHNDVSEIYINLFDSLTEFTNNLEMRIHIPDNKELLRAWAHGPLTGNIKIIDNQTIHVVASNISENEAIDVRFIFDKNVLNNSNKFSNVEAFDKIIEVETKRADEANKEREELEKILLEEAKEAVEYFEKNISRNNYNSAVLAVNYLPESVIQQELKNRISLTLEKLLKLEKEIRIRNCIILGFWLVGLIFLINRFYRKYDKEYNSIFNGDYYRDFPANYGPEIVSYLIDKQIKNDDLSASLMNLIYKKAVLYEEQFVGKRNSKTYLLTPNIEGKVLTNEELQLIEFLLEGKATTLYDIKKRAKKDYDNFILGFTIWKKSVENAGEAEQFYENNSSKKLLHILYSLLGICLVLVIGFNQYTTIPVLVGITLIVSIVSLIYFATSNKRTIKGNEDYKRWMGLKNFLKDFSNMDKRELPEIELWEKYLVYAMPLGCAKKLSKNMEIRIKEFDSEVVGNTSLDLGRMHQMVIINDIVNNSIGASIAAAYSEKTRKEMSDIAKSSSSSGRGFGGGFSGGGGFGGGGGGGGRF